MESPVPLWNCSGCRDCEMACSFRATGMFWRPASAIHVLEGGADSRGPYRIEVDAAECDLCVDELEPRCQAACRSRALDVDTIRRLRAQSTGQTLH